MAILNIFSVQRCLRTLTPFLLSRSSFRNTSEIYSKYKFNTSNPTQYEKYKDNEAVHSKKRSRGAIMQIARDTCYVWRRYSLSNGEKQHWRRKDTDSMSIAMLKTEGFPRQIRLMLLRLCVRSIYETISPLAGISCAERNFNNQSSHRKDMTRYDARVKITKRQASAKIMQIVRR